MLKAARNVGQHSNRDTALILLAYRHGLRVSKLVALRWEQVDFNGGTIYINRLNKCFYVLIEFFSNPNHTKKETVFLQGFLGLADK